MIPARLLPLSGWCSPQWSSRGSPQSAQTKMVHHKGKRGLIRAWSVLWLIQIVIVGAVTSSFAQDARELEQERAASKKLKGEHPLVELMRSRKSSLRPELVGVHPRVYVTDKELEELRQRARTTHRDLWQKALLNVRALKADPPPSPAQKRRDQNEVGLAIAEAAFIY